MIPAITLLCIILILFSVKNRYRMLKEEEEKTRLMVYQSQVEDMAGYIRDLERMQDGIRGMKHDMKNYIADIQALLRLDQEKDEVRGELDRYLQGMERALSEFSISCKTGNLVTDVIINRFFRQAKQKNTRLECCFSFPQDAGIDPFDLSIILNNG